MTLIKSISGIRGTIGGAPGDTLSPIDIAKFTAAYGHWLLSTGANAKVVVGRDARISGVMVNHLVVGTLMGLGIDVVDLDLATTPTVEMAVPAEFAGGGIILTASHNPKQWNALKLLNAKGEFISDADGKEILRLAESDELRFADVDRLGAYTKKSFLQEHIDQILALPWVDVESIKSRNFKVVIDCVNSVGGIVLPTLLEQLGVQHVTKLFCEPDGHFPHNPEPLPENLVALSEGVRSEKADLGIAVDPDVDRLCFVNENGSMFGEEYTLVSIASYILQNTSANYYEANGLERVSVSNLSSTRALRDVTQQAGGTYYASAVGEVNVVNLMKAHKAIIGGEGNGGIILPALHYGRDALVGIAIFLTQLAKGGKRISELRAELPNYFMSKNKIELTPDLDVDAILKQIENQYKNEQCSTVDGLKIDFEEGWVHLRKSNTEPIIRIYSEAGSIEKAQALATNIMNDIRACSKK